MVASRLRGGSGDVGDIAMVLSEHIPGPRDVGIGPPFDLPPGMLLADWGSPGRFTAVACSAVRMGARLRASLEVPCKASGIVKDYAFELYFPAQRLSWSNRFACTPMLLLIEYLVYRVDAIAERAKDLDLDADRSDNPDSASQYRATFNAYKARIESVLHLAGAYNDAVAQQLKLGERFVYLENKVTASRGASHAEVLELAELRPSDVRLLHAMTYALQERPVDQRLLDLLWPVEVLADIGNDLAHYRDDVASGRYNTYDALVRLYGPDAPDRLRAEIVRYEELFHTRLAAFPPRRQRELATLSYRRYRARTRVIPAPMLQTWQPIADPEELHAVGHR